ncbi:uncharacterized protein EI90DRAFT_3027611 [Cantharellus anzutake]|uniref:uncharacterized protein n=1 Tax=Cantharellus anzutake TaxID=1750568 RepID=UPI001906C63D|nr:uncharacterized protein EI90DRAFT_3027611 [Cantharellus anzutake]KAF8343942.1 hypothetical protein EI90DRAFT_3027611 [Cantharellus anzutake]
MSLFGGRTKANLPHSNERVEVMKGGMPGKGGITPPAPVSSRANVYINQPTRMSSKTASKFGLSTMYSPFSPNPSRRPTRGWTIPVTVADPLTTTKVKPAVAESYGKSGSSLAPLGSASNPGGLRSMISRTFNTQHRPQNENSISTPKRPPEFSEENPEAPAISPASDVIKEDSGKLAGRVLGAPSHSSERKVTSIPSEKEGILPNEDQASKQDPQASAAARGSEQLTNVSPAMKGKHSLQSESFAGNLVSEPDGPGKGLSMLNGPAVAKPRLTSGSTSSQTDPKTILGIQAVGSALEQLSPTVTSSTTKFTGLIPLRSSPGSPLEATRPMPLPSSPSHNPSTNGLSTSVSAVHGSLEDKRYPHPAVALSAPILTASPRLESMFSIEQRLQTYSEKPPDSPQSKSLISPLTSTFVSALSSPLLVESRQSSSTMLTPRPETGSTITISAPTPLKALSSPSYSVYEPVMDGHSVTVHPSGQIRRVCPKIEPLGSKDDCQASGGLSHTVKDIPSSVVGVVIKTSNGQHKTAKLPRSPPPRSPGIIVSCVPSLVPISDPAPSSQPSMGTTGSPDPASEIPTTAPPLRVTKSEPLRATSHSGDWDISTPSFDSQIQTSSLIPVSGTTKDTMTTTTTLPNGRDISLSPKSPILSLRGAPQAAETPTVCEVVVPTTLSSNTPVPLARIQQSPPQSPITSGNVISTPNRVRAKVLPPIYVPGGSSIATSPPPTPSFRSRFTPVAKSLGSPLPAIPRTPLKARELDPNDATVPERKATTERPLEQSLSPKAFKDTGSEGPSVPRDDSSDGMENQRVSSGDNTPRPNSPPPTSMSLPLEEALLSLLGIPFVPRAVEPRFENEEKSSTQPSSDIVPHSSRNAVLVIESPQTVDSSVDSVPPLSDTPAPSALHPKAITKPSSVETPARLSDAEDAKPAVNPTPKPHTAELLPAPSASEHKPDFTHPSAAPDVVPSQPVQLGPSVPGTKSPNLLMKELPAPPPTKTQSASIQCVPRPTNIEESLEPREHEGKNGSKNIRSAHPVSQGIPVKDSVSSVASNAPLPPAPHPAPPEAKAIVGPGIAGSGSSTSTPAQAITPVSILKNASRIVGASEPRYSHRYQAPAATVSISPPAAPKASNHSFKFWRSSRSRTPAHLNAFLSVGSLPNLSAPVEDPEPLNALDEFSSTFFPISRTSSFGSYRDPAPRYRAPSPPFWEASISSGKKRLEEFVAVSIPPSKRGTPFAFLSRKGRKRAVSVTSVEAAIGGSQVIGSVTDRYSKSIVSDVYTPPPSPEPVEKVVLGWHQSLASKPDNIKVRRPGVTWDTEIEGPSSPIASLPVLVARDNWPPKADNGQESEDIIGLDVRGI